ncbi:hypothetical protein VKS41_001609 [Umbelopsis sp. WA50703]
MPAYYSHQSWIAEAFQKYHVQNPTNSETAHLRHIESRYLGTATLQLGPQRLPHATFYEITESEISEQGMERKHVRSSSSHDSLPAATTFHQEQFPHEDHENSDSQPKLLSTECCSASETSCGRPDCAYLSLSESIAATTLLEKYAADDDANFNNMSSVALPPKKRKRRRIVRQDIVFTFVPHEGDEQYFPTDADYYCFPKDALAEPLSEEPPFEIVVSFQLCKTMLSEDFLDSVCPSSLFNGRPFLPDSGYQNLSFSRSSHRRFTDPGQKPVAELAFQTMQVVNLRVSNAPTHIYNAIKKSVSRFEVLCRRMVELSKQHSERVAHRKAEELSVSRSVSTSKSLPQAADDEDDEMEDKHHGYESTDTICKIDNWSSDENGWDKESHADGSARAVSVSATSDTHMDMSISGNKSSGSEAVASPKLSASLPSKLPSNGLHQTKQPKQQALSSVNMKKCLYCGSKSTPMWRRGPQGAGTLCNACGVKWKHGKILCGSNTEPHATANGDHNGKERKGSKADKKRKKAEASAAAKKEKRPKVKNRKGKKVKTAMDSVEEDPNAFTLGMELDEDEDSNVDPVGDSTPKGDAYLYDDEEDDDDSSTLAGQDHMDIQTAVKAEPVFAIPFARTNTSERHATSQISHGHPSQQQALLQPGRSTWDTIYSSSSSSSISTFEPFSPRESYASSPTSSPSSLLLDINQSDKRHINSAIAEGFAQSAVDDAVEAATVLTMLRSS